MLMARVLNWESRIGRRLRLRDLHILFAVVQHGSMAKAGAELGMSQSAVSQAVAALEHATRGQGHRVPGGPGDGGGEDRMFGINFSGNSSSHH